MKALAVLIAATLAGPARAAPPEPATCRTVRLASPGWSDIDATNAVLGLLLKGMGYRSDVRTLSVPLAYQGLRSGQLDVFLGNWMPAQGPMVAPLLERQQVELLGTNLDQARFTLAVPAYAAEAGVRSFADLAARADQFSRRIYGIEAGAPANEAIKKMIASNAHGLGGWTLVESSDTGLLSQVTHDIRARRMTVFLAWEPHVMNARFDLRYLTGGEAHFGADAGAASVRTVGRTGYRAQCPNVARLLAQLKFTVPLENQLIALTVDKRQPADVAATTVLRQHPDLLQRWLDGVVDQDGAPALAAVRKLIRS